MAVFYQKLVQNHQYTYLPYLDILINIQYPYLNVLSKINYLHNKQRNLGRLLSCHQPDHL